MKIYLATDHAGFDLKNVIKDFLAESGYEVIDCGANYLDSDDDFPDYIRQAAMSVAQHPKDRKAIVFGGSGQGEAMLANRYKGVRAAVYYGGAVEIVKLSREHNDANVLSIGARFVDSESAKQLVNLWLKTTLLTDEKYQRRINKMDV